MQCSNCDQDLLPGAAFCGNCGAKIVSVASSVPVQNEVVTQPQVDQSQQPTYTGQQTLNTPTLNPVGQGSTVAVPSGNKSGLSIASMVIGILSILTMFIIQGLPFVLGIVSIILGIVGKKKGGKALAFVGIITGAISVLFVTLITLLFVIMLSAAGV